MVKIRGETVIARPVEDVFDFVADERTEIQPVHMVRAEKVTPGPVAKGTRRLATIESRGRPLDMAMEVTDYTRPRRLASTTSMSTAEIRGVVTFEPDPAGTRMRWSWDLKPKGFLKFLAPVIGRLGRRQEEEVWAGLKRYLENTEPTQNTGDLPVDRASRNGLPVAACATAPCSSRSCGLLHARPCVGMTADRALACV